VAPVWLKDRFLLVVLLLQPFRKTPTAIVLGGGIKHSSQ
jgi:hypothetical protein